MAGSSFKLFPAHSSSGNPDLLGPGMTAASCGSVLTAGTRDHQINDEETRESLSASKETKLMYTFGDENQLPEPERSYTGPEASSREELLKTKMPPFFSADSGKGVFTPVHPNENNTEDGYEESTEAPALALRSPGLSPSRTPCVFTWNRTLPRGTGEHRSANISRKEVARGWAKPVPVLRAHQEQRFSPYPEPRKTKYKPGIPVPIAPVAPANLQLPFDLEDGDTVQEYVAGICAGDSRQRFRKRGINKIHFGPHKSTPGRPTEDTRIAAMIELSVRKYKRVVMSRNWVFLDSYNLNATCSVTFIDLSKHQLQKHGASKSRWHDADVNLLQIRFIIPPQLMRILMFVAPVVKLFLSSKAFSKLATFIKTVMIVISSFIIWGYDILGLDGLVQVQVCN